jgi:V/A-type H+-transporting ATPase subunit B
VAQLVRQIRPSNKKGAVVFAAIGIKYEDASYLMQSISAGGNFDSTTVFLNLADEPSINSLLLARSALTFAEYLAFEKGYDVITILYDMTNYCDALREVSSRREEIPPVVKRFRVEKDIRDICIVTWLRSMSVPESCRVKQGH